MCTHDAQEVYAEAGFAPLERPQQCRALVFGR
jgi:hypothetical protein